MLGTVVVRLLVQEGYDVVTSDSRYGGRPDDGLIDEVRAASPRAVINCLGVIPATLSEAVPMMMGNGLLPIHLASAMPGVRIIHASTDCVFDGKRGWYRADEEPNATDAYGFSKRLGEKVALAPNATVFRASIIGPPASAGRGLLGWFLSSPGPVDGWSNHHWNGITTLEWARLARRALEGEIGPGLHQPTTSMAVSKLELLRLFAGTFGHAIEIRPVVHREALDRTLAPTLEMPSLEVQLGELAEWMDRAGTR
jgi:dTDP-4-dehydrorhamnose reductase